MGLSWRDFIKLGQLPAAHDANAFNMTILALQFSRAANGVSQLHGEVSRRMWHGLWPEKPMEDVPIGAITNGVHSRTWISGPMKDLFDETITG